MWQNLHVNVEKVNFHASVNCIYRLEYLPEQAHKGAANKEERNQFHIFLNTKTKRTLSKLVCVEKDGADTQYRSNVLQLHALSFEIFFFFFVQRTSYSFPEKKT